MKIRVLIADDHPLLLEGFSAVLKKNANIHVVGTAKTIKELLALYDEVRPDVAVVDVFFDGSDMSGLDAMERVLKHHSGARFIVITMHDQDRMVREAYSRGAKAFLTKNMSPDLLVEAVETVAKGEIFFTPAIQRRLALLSTMPEPKTPRDLLTERELEVFKYAAEGKSNQDISAKLNVSTRTVANAIFTIKSKLEIHGRGELTRIAIQYGIIKAEHL